MFGTHDRGQTGFVDGCEIVLNGGDGVCVHPGARCTPSAKLDSNAPDLNGTVDFFDGTIKKLTLTKSSSKNTIKTEKDKKEAEAKAKNELDNLKKKAEEEINVLEKLTISLYYFS